MKTMATKKQTSECNVRPAIAGNVRQSPDRTYLYLVKEEETNEKEENVLLLCQVSPLRELNVNELAEEKGTTVKWWPSDNNNNNKTSFLSHLFPLASKRC